MTVCVFLCTDKNAGDYLWPYVFCTARCYFVLFYIWYIQIGIYPNNQFLMSSEILLEVVNVLAFISVVGNGVDPDPPTLSMSCC